MHVLLYEKSYYIGRVQQIQLLQSGSAPQQFSLLKVINVKCRNKQIYLRDVLFRFLDVRCASVINSIDRQRH